MTLAKLTDRFKVMLAGHPELADHEVWFDDGSELTAINEITVVETKTTRHGRVDKTNHIQLSDGG